MRNFSAMGDVLQRAAKTAPQHIAPARRLAMVAGLSLAPFSVFAATSQNWTIAAATAIPALAAAAFALMGTRMLAPAGKGQDHIANNALEYLIDHMRDATLQFDPAGELIFGSRSASAIFGCEKYELAGNGLIDRTHIADRPIYMTALSNARDGGKERRVELRMRRDNPGKSGVAPEFVWIEATFIPMNMRGEHQAPFGVVLTLHDISHRKQNEHNMRQAQKAAEEASRAKNQFLAVVGHELRTPLNAIVGFSDMMRNDIGGELEPAHKEYAELINQSGHHLLEMVNMLLDMSKIEAGRFEISAEPFEPENLIAPCLQIVSKAAREKNVGIEVDLGRNIPEIIGDERACRQIAINLLSNAIKFSKPGDKVTWSIKRQGKSLKMSFSDTGIGMSKAVVERLGEPFYQAQSAADRRYEGTGLGVSIVKGLIELHQGSFLVSSEPDLGTTITLLLPINGPETKMEDTGSIERLKTDEAAEQPQEIARQKRTA